MATFSELISTLAKSVPFLRTVFIVLVIYAILSFIYSLVKRALLRRAKTKHQRSNVEIFTRLFKYLTLLVLVLFAIFSYAGSWAGLGLSFGLLSAALGWALQKPITGIAAWIMVVSKRPFEIGDRVIIAGVRGDVVDITLTHIYVAEIGGLVPGEESSGRIIMIPNSVLFEKNITNYTSKDEYVLDSVPVLVTYEGNLDKAKAIALAAAKKHVKEFIPNTKEPYVRTFFKDNGIRVSVRYFVPAAKLQEYSSNITQEILKQISKTKGVEIAYPHTEVLYRKKR